MAKQVGDTSIKMNHGQKIDVKNVYHIPEMAVSLLSVNKIVEKGNIVVFNKRGFKITNSSNELLFACKAKNGNVCHCL